MTLEKVDKFEYFGTSTSLSIEWQDLNIELETINKEMEYE